MMNDDQILHQRGLAAESLLADPAFQAVLAALDDINIRTFFYSPAADTDGRERTYHKAQALQDIVAALREWVSVKDQILARQDADEIDADAVDPQSDL